MLRENFVHVLRIHVAGDFYSEEYIDNWIEIIRRSPGVVFFGYTRTWAVPDYAAAIRRLSRESNMRLWLSFDRLMPAPPKWPGVRRAYLSMNDEDQPRVKVDLVFRDKPHLSIMKRSTYGALVCPYENNVTETTCSKCSICWRLQNAATAPRLRTDNAVV